MKMKIRIGLLLLALSAIPHLAYSYTYAWVVSFADKENSAYSVKEPEGFLSARAIERRAKQNIAIDYTDLPVNRNYIDSIAKFNAVFHVASKWLNSAVYYTNDPDFPRQVMQVSFVADTVRVYDISGLKKSSSSDKLKVQQGDIAYGMASNQIELFNAQYLHDAGYEGEGMQIAVIDAGFSGVDTISYFQHLYDDDRILGTYDFVDGGEDVYNYHYHGTMVLSCMAAVEAGVTYGTAVDASYYLLRSEDVNSESPLEGENWIAAVEWADSAGVDVVNTSLGYGEMDVEALNFNYNQMDGHTLRISRVSDIAFQKGMFMVNSAGNEGDSKITAPSDAVYTLAIGATGPDSVLTGFSGRGPSYDARVKPDVCAQGAQVYVVTPNGQLTTSQGTSFSGPLTAGAVACLWQTVPDKTNTEILRAVRRSASAYDSPDSLYGYGIPDFEKAFSLLKVTTSVVAYASGTSVYPNPFTDELIMNCPQATGESLHCVLYNLSGKMVWRKSMLAQENISLSELANLPAGMYVLHIEGGAHSFQQKLIKQ